VYLLEPGGEFWESGGIPRGLYEYTQSGARPITLVGDVDGDGKLTVKDALRLLRLMVGLG
jgi:hypothetical protein